MWSLIGVNKIVEIILNLAIKNGSDYLLKDKASYKRRLRRVIKTAIKNYSIKYGNPKIKGKIFYRSNTFIADILKINYFEKNEPEIETESLIEKFSSESNIVKPSNDEIIKFICEVDQLIKKDEKLEKIFIKENINKKIFYLPDDVTAIKNDIRTIKNTFLDSSITFYQFIKELAPIDTDEINSYNKFYYKSGAIPFIERKEMADLESFKNDNKKFSWWCLTGQGGSGKSRLAYEFASKHKADNNWIVNFLQWKNSIITLPLGKFEKNIFLIIDYVSENAENIGKWLNNISEISLTSKIRILLIEREDIKNNENGEPSYPYWYTKLVIENRIKGFQFKKTFLNLESLPIDKIISLISNYIFSQINQKIDEEIIFEEIFKRLNEIDPLFQRPLYALFLSDAWIEHRQNMRHWSRKNLSDWIFDSELRKLNSYFDHNNIVVDTACQIISFATAITKIDVSEISQLESLRESISTLKKYATEKNCDIKDLYIHLGANANNPLLLNALEPDIMGEYFFIKYLEKINDGTSNKTFEAFMNSAWKYPDKFASFLTRLIVDFPEYALIEKILTEPELEEIEVKINYAILLFNINNDELAAKKMVDISRKYKDTAIIQHIYSIWLANHIRDAESDDMIILYNEFEQLSIEWANNEAIQEEYIRALLTVSSKLEVPNLIDKLDSILNSFPGNDIIKCKYSMSLVNLIEKQNNNKARNNIIRKIECIAKKDPDNSFLQEYYATGLTNLLFTQKNYKEKNKTLKKIANILSNISSSHSLEFVVPILLDHFTEAINAVNPNESFETLLTFTEILPFDEKNQEIASDILLNQMLLNEGNQEIIKFDVISNRFPDNEPIQEKYSEYLSYLCIHQKELDKIEKLVDKLKPISERFRDNHKIQYAYGAGLFMLAEKQEKLSEQEKVVAEFSSFESKYAHIDNISLFYSLALSSLAGRQKNIIEKSNTINELEKIIEKISDNQDINSRYVSNLSDLSDNLELDQVKAIISKIRLICLKFDEDIEIKAYYILTLINYANRQLELGKKIDFHLLLEQVTDIANPEEFKSTYLKIFENGIEDDIEYKNGKMYSIEKFKNSLIQILNNESFNEDIYTILNFISNVFDLSIESYEQTAL